MREIFIIGSKGIPAKYGGFETFVEKLTENQVSNELKYHVACLSEKNNDEFYYNGARCFNVKTLNIGPAKAVYYDLLALNRAIEYIKEKKVVNPIIYILACRIGPFMWIFKKKIEKLNIKIYINPDGHEWKRGKWNFFIKKYWKISEQYMIKNGTLIICDSKNIEKYIREDYKKYNPKTTFIAYGADIEKTKLTVNDESVVEWYTSKDISINEYYLIVGRFVPENNYELIIKEFMKSKTKRNLVIISNVEENKFFAQLEANTNFKRDSRIKFVGTVYEKELLKFIRENAYGYFHGHEVGGTNPSLLEAMSGTKLNLLLDVGFNKEVGRESAIYFNKEEGNLANRIEEVEKIEKDKIENIGKEAKGIIEEYYSWNKIVGEYERLFEG